MSAWRVEGAVRVSRSFTLPNSRPEPGKTRAVEAERESGEGGRHVETGSGRGSGRDAHVAGRTGRSGRMGSFLPCPAYGGGDPCAKRALAPAAAGGRHRARTLLQPPPAPRAGLSAPACRLSGAGLFCAAPAARAGLPRRSGGACRLVRGAVSFVRCADGYIPALSRAEKGVPVAVWVRGGLDTLSACGGCRASRPSESVEGGAGRGVRGKRFGVLFGLHTQRNRYARLPDRYRSMRCLSTTCGS